MKSKQSNSKKTLSPFISPFLSPGFQRSQDDSSMDWSVNIPTTPVSPSSYVSSAGEYISLPHVPLSNIGLSSKNRAESDDSGPFLLDYSNNQLVIASSWDGPFHMVSIFRTKNSGSEDTANILESIEQIGLYISNHPADKKPPVGEFVLVVKSLWKLIETIYTSKWDLLIFDKEASLTIQKSVRDRIVPIYRKIKVMSFKSANSKENPTSLNPTTSPPKSVVSPSPTTKLIVPTSLNNDVETVIKKVPKPLNMKKSYA